MNQQREVVYKYRREILEGRDMSEPIKEELRGVFERIVQEYTPGDFIEDWDMDGLFSQVRQIFDTTIDEEDLDVEAIDRDELTTRLYDDALGAYAEREEELGQELMRQLERAVLLQIIDERWREHLYDMDYLREGIHLRGFAQRDPLVEYKNEGFALFRDLMNSIWEDFGRYIFHVQVEIEPAQPAPPLSRSSQTRRASSLTYTGGGPEQPSALYDAAEQAGVAVAEGGAEIAALPEVETRHVDEHEKIGRNDPCWCGSGKKFKKCHGA
jgi:preprotein translocase subunit SecA